MSPADGPASPSYTRAMPQAVAVAYTASTLGAAARCSKSTSFLPLMPLSRLVARHSRMLSRSYGGRVCGAVACVWPVLTRLLSVPCLGHKNRTRGAAQGPSKPRNRQMSQPCSHRAGPSPRLWAMRPSCYRLAPLSGGLSGPLSGVLSTAWFGPVRTYTL